WSSTRPWQRESGAALRITVMSAIGPSVRNRDRLQKFGADPSPHRPRYRRRLLDSKTYTKSASAAVVPLPTRRMRVQEQSEKTNTVSYTPVPGRIYITRQFRRQRLWLLPPSALRCCAGSGSIIRWRLLGLAALPMHIDAHGHDGAVAFLACLDHDSVAGADEIDRVMLLLVHDDRIGVVQQAAAASVVGRQHDPSLQLVQLKHLAAHLAFLHRVRRFAACRGQRSTCYAGADG